MRPLMTTFCAICALGAAPAMAADRADVLTTYADIAAAAYGDSLTKAEALRGRIDALLAAPSPEALDAARAAWIEARVPYQQTEAYRFGNPIVDDWEGKVNSWPLDEGLIDYVDPSYGGATEANDLAALNVIATPRFTVAGRDVDATEITAALLEDDLQEADEVEANVATGYHAVEFLLWGQDLNGVAPGAGARPWTDYAMGAACTHGNCDRRGAYLKVATDLLVSDLAWMTAQWGPQGAARAAVTADEPAGIAAMLTGMGSLSFGELAGQRMKLGVMLNDPEEEHDCFSDNTHNSQFYDGLGIRNVYLGRYVRVDGTVVSGPSLSDLTAEVDPAADAAMRADLDATMDRLGAIKTVAEAGMRYDQMLARGNVAGEALIMDAVDALVAQTRSVERIAAALAAPLTDVGAAGSPDAVFE